MKIIIVDDEQMALCDIKDAVEELMPSAALYAFDNCEEALASAKTMHFDIAFLDIAMPGKDGIALSKELKDIYSKTNIIFVTGYSDYAVNAFSINASGYILKPAKKEDIQNAMDHLRNPVTYSDKALRVQCFGNFEVFYGADHIHFKRSLTKELFAYLVNLKGTSTNTNELCTVLFQNDSVSNKNYLRNLIADLKHTLRLFDAEDVFICKRNNFSIDPSKFECDYYDFLKYDVKAINSYSGSYMAQYSWAEMTNGFLSKC